jgi:hypothetical protein
MKKSRKKPMVTRKCALEPCEVQFTTNNSAKAYCCVACYRKGIAERAKVARAENARLEREAREYMESVSPKAAPKVKKLSEREKARLDKDQRLLDKMVDQRLSMDLDVKIWKRGEPGFDEVAATVTPLHLIKKGTFCERSVLGNSSIKSAAIIPERRERELRL